MHTHTNGPAERGRTCTRCLVLKAPAIRRGLVSALFVLGGVPGAIRAQSSVLPSQSEQPVLPSTSPTQPATPQDEEISFDLAWLEYQLAVAEYELALVDYEQALRDYEEVVETYAPLFAEPLNPDDDPQKKAVEEAKKIIDQRKAQVEQNNQLQAEKEKKVNEALGKVLEAAAKDPKAKVKGGILVFGVTQGQTTVIRVTIESGFDPNSVVTVTINTPGKPTTVTVQLDKDGKSKVDIVVPKVLLGGLYNAEASGTNGGKPIKGNYDRIPVITPPNR